MIYKAKKSYFKLKDSENFCAYWSANKHRQLLAGGTIDVTDLPKSLKKHLEQVNVKKLKEDK
jgi:hypothetical protein|tara:strand:+ start:129 stop:314 length:186 start_codon:yes stop_codon:yes gene_type:complete